MFMKIPPEERLYVLTMSETISRLSHQLSKSSEKGRGFASVLTDKEMQSLRAEMVRDGAYMKEWLTLKPYKS
jgi:hypothetical protein